MRRAVMMATPVITLVTAWLIAGEAKACLGQIAVSPQAVFPGGEIKIRGYGFWADPRPVTLAWENGPVIATVQPDTQGNFEITVRAPIAEGTFRVVASQGEADPAPSYATVSVGRHAGDAGLQSPEPVPQVARVATLAAASLLGVAGILVVGWRLFARPTRADQAGLSGAHR